MVLPTIAIIGAGNMGTSLIGGLIKDGHPPSQIWATDVREDQLAALHENFQIHTTDDCCKVISEAEVVILAVKPQKMAEVLSQIAIRLNENKPLIISIAAGVLTGTIQKYIDEPISIVRAMPNTPALIGCGATALFANDRTSLAERNLAESILRAVGITVWLKTEALMDVVTALSGSGPAYFFAMMETLANIGQEMGLSPETSRLLTLQTALGAARMAIESNDPLATLRQNVTSPGGTTEAALSVLKTQQMDEMFRKALEAAKLRSEELAKN